MEYSTLFAAEPKMLLYFRFIQKRAFEFESECVDSHVIFWLEEGRFSWHFDGGAEGIAETGDLLFCPAGVRFHRKMIEPTTLHVLRVTLEGVDDADLPPACTRIFNRDRMLHDLQYLPQFISPKRTMYAAERHYLADIWYLLLEENELLQSERRRTMEDPLIAGAVDYIERRLHMDIDLNQLAAQCMLSPSGFIRRFRKVMGVTPMQYVIDTRMNRAMHLLCETAKPIAEVARRCGYENEFYFSASFKKAAGLSPTAYREMHRI